ncbi:MAG: glucose 1-dehydrogenase [Chitinophagaceae bacterium]|uniref:SDR family NAD(P)-dependent oxidoreductase n=1 Tax=unclassified Paraflavitalea TaxID=2798305 RepID=UPI003D33BE2F|nr:glucose 1-dehydrogenase [Chitinophagaceae bacterium]
MLRLDHKTAVITGAGSGIGKAMAVLFAQQGAFVHILDMDENGANATVKEIQEAGGGASFHKADVSDQAAIKAIMDAIASKTGTIHILINNAGIAHVGSALNTEEADFDRLMRVNVKGVYNCVHTALPYMIDKNAVILNLASIAASIGLPDRFAYSTTKGAIVGMTLSIAKDYINKGVRCNCISPARVHTPFVDGFIAKNYPGKEAEMFEKLSKTQPIGRMGQPSEIAFLALYLCSDEAGFITGCDYPIDGGFIKLNN